MCRPPPLSPEETWGFGCRSPRLKSLTVPKEWRLGRTELVPICRQWLAPSCNSQKGKTNCSLVSVSPPGQFISCCFGSAILFLCVCASSFQLFQTLLRRHYQGPHGGGGRLGWGRLAAWHVGREHRPQNVQRIPLYGFVFKVSGVIRLRRFSEERGGRSRVQYVASPVSADPSLWLRQPGSDLLWSDVRNHNKDRELQPSPRWPRSLQHITHRDMFNDISKAGTGLGSNFTSESIHRSAAGTLDPGNWELWRVVLPVKVDEMQRKF